VVIPFEFCHDLWHQKIKNPGAIVRHYLCDPTFSRFDTIPECDRQTHDDGIYRARIVSCGNNLRWGEVDGVKEEAGSKCKVNHFKKSDQLFVQEMM